MVKTERMQDDDVVPAPRSAWRIAEAAWFVPGVGHLLLKRWGRAIIMGGAVWVCFFSGMAMGGHLFDVSIPQEPLPPFQLLIQVFIQFLPVIGNLGTGILYIVCWLLGIGFASDPQQAARTTYEYGTHFLIVAGLLNYLTMLDAFDIAAGRKS